MMKLLWMFVAALAVLLTIVGAVQAAPLEREHARNASAEAWNVSENHAPRWLGMARENESEVRVRGLENAVVRVRGNETKEHLEAVFARINATRQARFANLTNLLAEQGVNGTVIMHGDGEARLFGFFKMKHQYDYAVAKNGSVERRGRWNDWLYKLED